MKKGGTSFRLLTTFLCPRFGHETYRTGILFLFLRVQIKERNKYVLKACSSTSSQNVNFVFQALKQLGWGSFFILKYPGHEKSKG